MTYEEIRERLSNVAVHPKRLKTYLKNHCPDLYDSIIQQTMFLEDNATFAERVHCIENDIHSRKLCAACSKAPVKFYVGARKYAEYCSRKCSLTAPLTAMKRTMTIKQRFGTGAANIEQSRQTRLKKYNGWSSSDFAQKCKATMKQRYGSETWTNDEKRKKTCMERYGVDHHMKCEVVKKAYLKRFADAHNGACCAFMLPDVVQKMKAGIRERAWKHVILDMSITPCFSHDEFVKCNDLNAAELNFVCNVCGTKFASSWDNGRHVAQCPKCFPICHGTSRQEIELYEFIKSISPNALHNVHSIISPEELDIYVPEKKLAIEYDGLYWHSTDRTSARGPSYHLNKTDACEAQGIRLIHVFENEWLTKKDIVKSRLKSILGTYSIVLHARKCVIKEVDSKLSKEFQEQNHIQGAANASVNYGLYFNDELVCLMTFSKARFTKKHSWEMLRFCSKLDYHVIGGAGKLLAHFERMQQPESIVSYADRRWSRGNVYKKLGFTLDHASAPNYWYFKPTNTSMLFNRIKFQKHRLPQLQTISRYDEKLSEAENMCLNGYLRIFDCGNLVFTKKAKA